MALFEYKEVDREYYERELRDFLPDKMIDCHNHVYHDGLRVEGEVRKPAQNWPQLVASTNPIEDLLETYRIMLPKQKVTPVIFGSPSFRFDIAKTNAYISRVAKEHNFPALMLSHPAMSDEEFERGIAEGGFKGVKVYLNFSPKYIPLNEIRIFDFAPHNHLRIMDKLGLVMMLHIPRSGRLKDEVNLRQIVEILEKYPNIKLILAHVGRAYNRDDIGDAFERLKGYNFYWDFCANTNEYVFEQLLKNFSVERIMYGTDMPILRMRMRRIEKDGSYANIVPRGLYGDVSGDRFMIEVDPPEADKLSFFIYEEILAMKKACKAVGFGPKEVESLFRLTAKKLFEVQD